MYTHTNTLPSTRTQAYATGTIIRLIFILLRYHRFNCIIADTLLQHLEKYISGDLVDALNKLSVILKMEDLEPSVYVAYELHKSIAANQERVATKIYGKMNDAITSEQKQLALQLQSTLLLLQDLALKHVHELTLAIGDQTLKQVTEVTTQLYKDLALVESVPHVAVQVTATENVTNTPTVMEGQEKLTNCLQRVVEIEECTEQATDITIESTDLMTAKPNEILCLEWESQLKEDTKEKTIAALKQVAYTESSCTDVNMEADQLEKLLHKRIARSTMEDLVGEAEEDISHDTIIQVGQKGPPNKTESNVVDVKKGTDSIIFVTTDTSLKDNIHCEVTQSIGASKMATISLIEVTSTENIEQLSDKKMTNQRVSISDVLPVESEKNFATEAVVPTYQEATLNQTLSKIGSEDSEVITKNVKEIKSVAKRCESLIASDPITGNFYFTIKC